MGNNHSKILSSRQRESKLKVVEPNQSHSSYGAQQEEVLAQDIFHSLLYARAPASGAIQQAFRADASGRKFGIRRR